MKLNIYIFCFISVLLASCGGNDAERELNKWTITLDREDKRPYGTFLAYESLKFYFSEAEIEALPSGFRYTNMDAGMRNNDSGISLLILEGIGCYLSEREWNDLKDFASRGNEVMIFASSFDEKLEKDLEFTKMLAGDERNFPNTGFKSFSNNDRLILSDMMDRKFGYEGRSIKGYFTITPDTGDDAAEINTDDDELKNNEQEDHVATIPDLLGYSGGKPNFIRYATGDGHISLHAAPLTLTNYFLLQDGNTRYIDGLWRTLPPKINHIYWDSFTTRRSQASSIDILWQHPATRLALTLAIIAISLYVLFEGKRKQRIITVIPPVRNDSVSFVETVGRLYYNKGNHVNLANKIVQQFLEWVRSNYFINTNLLDEHFINQFTIKSGQSEMVSRWITGTINDIKKGQAKIDDSYLYNLYSVTQKIYNKEVIDLTNPENNIKKVKP